MAETFDAIVVGVGAMGSAACHQLARRGLRVLGIEQFDLGHDKGSSHGRSRVIRKAYFEDPRYVPLAQQAYEAWRGLEAETGEQLLHLIGCLNMGPSDHACIHGVRSSAEQHGLSHEVLDCSEIRRRWPGFAPGETDIGIYEADGGFLVPEVCVALHVELARSGGAVIHARERVLRWSATAAGVSVETDVGQYNAANLVITAGPWMAKVASDLGLPLRVERQVQFWFQPEQHDLFTMKNMPSFIHFVGDRAYYGIPMREQEGMKVARHHGGEETSADEIDRTIRDDDEADVRAYLKKHLPDANGPLLDAEVCMYTNTPDDHFVIDRHPQHENVLIAGGFSGHGFKFAPVVGGMLVEMVLEGKMRQPIELFSMNRFIG